MIRRLLCAGVVVAGLGLAPDAPPLADTTGAVTLNWSPPAEVGRPSYLRTNIYLITERPQQPTTMLEVGSVEGWATTTFVVTGLTRGQRYTFAVTAVDAVTGESGYAYPVTVDVPRVPVNPRIFHH